MNTATIVQKLWNYCNVLRDDGMSYGDYVEAAPRQLLPALLYLLHPCSRAHPCARGIRTSCSAQLTFALTLALSQRERGPKGAIADERTRQLDCCSRRNSTSSIHGVVLLRCSRPLLPARLYLLHPCSGTFRHPWRSQAPYNQKSLVPEIDWP